jgi:tetratricopeptide (TPR) repeat protein
LLLRNDLAEADKQAKAAAAAVPPEDFLTFVPVMLADGEVALALKENDRALARAEQAILFLRRARFRYLLSDALYLRGRALWQSGRIDQAYEVLRQARTEAEAVGSRRSLLSILAALSELETQRGHVDEAMALRHNVEGIAHHVKHHSYC